MYNRTMEPFITKLPMAANAAQVLVDLAHLLENHTSWDPHNQIGIRCRPGAKDPWKDAAGSLYDPETKEKLASEEEFTEWCPSVPIYTQTMVRLLESSERVVFGRVRFMRSMPKTGLSMHVDTERRYHLVLDTNPSAIFAECFAEGNVRCVGYHMPRDGHWYRVDTLREHFVYNGGWTPRIHLVADIAKIG
jgi:hypothetical protein